MPVGICNATGYNYWKGKKLTEEQKRRRPQLFKKGPKPPHSHSFEKGHRMNFKTGQYTTVQGYVVIYVPNHPLCKGKKIRHLKRSRLVVEKYLGRYLKSTEIVHHINEVKDDDRIENFIVFKNTGYHCVFHRWKYDNPKGIVFDGRKI